MSLAPGTVLGPYEVTAQIGVGGMGEVYRATDTRLKRAVAIKVLPESVAADADRLVRLQREAEVLASLNHPNIAAIYGLEEGGPARALVMELVEGPTLADRIAQGALPVDEALAIARQIAGALETAHEQGIIHRDLKPANVKVRPDGAVKLLDFGLAKALDPEAAGVAASSHSLSPTITTPAMTRAGVILGTAAYMSPEQARGKVIDARADIWAFGVVLYEMLSGSRAFDGEDATEVLGAVVRLDPDMDAVPAHVPARLRQVIRACLQRNVKQRLAHMQDVRLALEGAFETSTAQSAGAAAIIAAPSMWRRALPLAATAIAGAAMAAGAAWTLWPQEPRAVSRSIHTLPQGRGFLNTQMNVISIDADGRQFLYNANGGLFVRRLDEVEDRLVPGTSVSGIFSPFFSPDGRSVGYFSQNDQSLRRLSVDGGASLRIAPIKGAGGGSWERDGTILYGQPDGVWQVSENGSDARRVIATKPGEQAVGPRRLPGGDWVLFTLIRRAGDTGATVQSDVVVESPASGERRVLKAGAGDARYVPTGHLLYLQEAVLYAVPFDVGRLEETGAPAPVIQGVLRANSIVGTGAGFYDISTRGTLVYVPGAITGAVLTTLAWVDPSGRRQAIDLPPGVYQHPRLSPDGKWLAVERQDRGSDIWLYETSGTTAERRLTEGGNNRYPVWSRDGTFVIFQSAREGDRVIFRQRADGTGAPERLTTPAKGVEHVPEAWSPTDDRLAFSAVSGGGVELWMFTLADRAAARVGMLRSTTPFNTVFSPDGKWVAYTERTNGVRTYVQSVTSGSRFQIGRDDETVHHPMFSGNRLIYFPGGNSAAVSRTISAGTTVTFGRPEPLPGNGLPLNVQPSTLLNHDVGKDGRFVTVLSGTGVDVVRNEIVLVQNWFEELKRLVPVN